jgi:hypothetical protein
LLRSRSNGNGASLMPAHYNKQKLSQKLSDEKPLLGETVLCNEKRATSQRSRERLLPNQKAKKKFIDADFATYVKIPTTIHTSMTPHTGGNKAING